MFRSKRKIGTEPTDNDYYRLRKKSAHTALATLALTTTCVAVFGNTLSDNDKEDGVLNDSPSGSIQPHVVLIGEPQAFNRDGIQRTLNKTARVLDYTTDGEIHMDSPTIRMANEKDVELADSDKNTPDCYSDEESASLDGLVRVRQHLSDGAYVLLIFGDEKMCNKDTAAAFATLGGKTSWYNQYDSRIFAHELGHNFGLNHAEEFDCSMPDSDGRRLFLKYEFLTIEQQLERGCEVQHLKDNSIDEYSSPETVMGNKSIGTDDVRFQAYTPVELHKIAPERFSVPIVDSVSARHYLSYANGSNVGVSITLPDSHPLHEIDPTAKTLSFGLIRQSYGSDDNIPEANQAMTIIPLLEGKDRTYNIDTPLFGTINNLTDNKKQYVKHPDLYYRVTRHPIIYMDETLDLVVSIGRDTEKNNMPYVQFNTFSETKKQRHDQRRIINERSHLIFHTSDN